MSPLTCRDLPGPDLHSLLFFRRVRGEGDVRGQRASAGGDRLRGHVGRGADAAAGVPAELPAARGRQRPLRGPLRCHRHDSELVLAAGQTALHIALCIALPLSFDRLHACMYAPVCIE